MQKQTGFIANIDISKEYDARYAADDVHYETFAGLAAFFGRDMQVHWHDRFFQLHCLETGKIELQLDDQHYSVQAPLFILTPPSVPHAFFTEPDSDGHVLTVRQELIWPLLARLYPGSHLAQDIPGICLSLADAPQALTALSHYWALIRHECASDFASREQTLPLLAQAVFALLLRNTKLEEAAATGMRGELQLFQRFNKLVDERFREHLPVPDYAQALGVTESRLNDLCRRFANRSPKRLIFDRLLREAKRLLLFSACTVHETAYHLGFKDPAYFARFFNRLEGCSPSRYRSR
ncbi:4-hydroxyphenylacetate catabolism regulatory protein HpaA [Serratia sp. NPDC078593]|uniref:4-hydroxyphenylacetate catabolism regulatory protein HpaA n=1 Tax=unclassified Serratia (in: enterobacteria) TaxID=2647522 RepID=UPI0037CFB02B